MDQTLGKGINTITFAHLDSGPLGNGPLHRFKLSRGRKTVGTVANTGGEERRVGWVT